MPHAVEVWDRSDSDSDTNPPLTLEQLGLESDTDSENEQIEQTEIQKKQKKKKKKPTQKSLQARGYLFEDTVDIDNIMDPTDMGLQVLHAMTTEIGRASSLHEPSLHAADSCNDDRDRKSVVIA